MDRSELQQKYGIIGESPALRHALDKVLQVAPTDITILLHGETGVGKDVTARAIHDLSPRKSGRLVIVNCGAIPEGIIESELFGHEKGAFTGAHESRRGYFEQADGGTIFLDEIVDTPKNVQVKLLRVLETGEFFRVGSSQVRKCNVRVIAASNKDMWKSVEDGDFREDLFYRLNTVTILIPPLRKRDDDILLIFQKFVAEFARKYDSVFRGMSDGARKLLLSYRWPGNIRELRNVAEQLVVLEKSQYVDEQVLTKYLKGRQRMGSPDNLPMLFQEEPQAGGSYQEAKFGDLQLLYRALLEMRSDMSDLKRMMGTLFYNTLGGERLQRSLPPPSGDRFSERSATGDSASSGFEKKRHPQDHELADYGAEQESNKSRPFHLRESQSMTVDIDPLEEQDHEERKPEWSEDQLRAVELFGDHELPSIETMEKFLIARALERYKGNRRKAARVLGMSERTLYRKIDQYGLI